MYNGPVKKGRGTLSLPIMQCSSEGGLRTPEEHGADETAAAEEEADDYESDEAPRPEFSLRRQHAAAERPSRVSERYRNGCNEMMHQLESCHTTAVLKKYYS